MLFMPAASVCTAKSVFHLYIEPQTELLKRLAELQSKRQSEVYRVDELAKQLGCMQQLSSFSL